MKSMKIDVERLRQIAVESNEHEKAFSSDLEENIGLYRASMKIALKIKRALKQHNMTQALLAEKMGLSPSIVSKSLNGKANLELKTIVKFEEILGINIIDRRISPYSAPKRIKYIIINHDIEIKKPKEKVFRNLEDDRCKYSPLQTKPIYFNKTPFKTKIC